MAMEISISLVCTVLNILEGYVPIYLCLDIDLGTGQCVLLVWAVYIFGLGTRHAAWHYIESSTG